MYVSVGPCNVLMEILIYHKLESFDYFSFHQHQLKLNFCQYHARMNGTNERAKLIIFYSWYSTLWLENDNDGVMIIIYGNMDAVRCQNHQNLYYSVISHHVSFTL